MQYLKYTKYDGFYARRTETGGYELVPIEKATVFKDGKARYFLNTTIPFDQRRNYQIVPCNNKNVTPSKQPPPQPKQELEGDTVAKAAANINQYALSQFGKLHADLEQRLTRCDNAIIDILHLLGDENCKLNAVQLCKVAKKIQEFEREHTAVKKELNRIDAVMEAVGNIKTKAAEFNYAPYKPKVIHNIKELIE